MNRNLQAFYKHEIIVVDLNVIKLTIQICKLIIQRIQFDIVNTKSNYKYNNVQALIIL